MKSHRPLSSVLLEVICSLSSITLVQCIPDQRASIMNNRKLQSGQLLAGVQNPAMQYAIVPDVNNITSSNRVTEPNNLAQFANATSVKQGKKKRKARSTARVNPVKIVEEIMKYYKKEDPPILDQPTAVKLGVYIISVYAISEQTMDYQVSMYLRQTWKDPRLRFEHLGQKVVQIRLGDKSWDKIWIPDTFLRNEKGASFHTVTVDNRLLKLNKDGNLWYVTKISAVLSCPMDLKKFPMDTQMCPMAFESFGYTMDTMYFEMLWKDNVKDTVEISDDLQMPQFTLNHRDLKDCSTNYTSGAYPCMEMQFFLRRDIGYFLIQVYVPSVLIVILSWVSFWINVDASPARVSLGLLTVLTTTTMSSGARSSLPRVSYIKAIDVWMIVCLIFVFMSLIEYAVVNVLARRVPRPSAAKQARNSGRTDGSGLGISRSRKYGDGPLNAGSEGRKGVGCFKRSGGGFSVECDTSSYGRFPASSGASGPMADTQQRSQPPSCSKGLGGVSAAAPCSSLAGPATTTAPPATSTAPPSPPKDGKYRARQVDKLSRKGFPLAFTAFNLIYWIFYTKDYDAPPAPGAVE